MMRHSAATWSAASWSAASWSAASWSAARWLSLVLALAACAGCAVGQEPPAPTAMVELRNQKPFVFGMGELGCNMPQDAKACLSVGAGMPLSMPPVWVKLHDFAIDEHEVTNDQYRFCVEMGECSLPAGNNGPVGAGEYYYGTEKFKDFPVVQVRWRQAGEYCAFVGKRLPTEFEWERVAGGPAQSASEKRVYPWSTHSGYEPPLRTCDDIDVNLRRCNSGATNTRAVKASKDDVVDTGNGKVYDLAGNVAEMTASDAYDTKQADPMLGCDPDPALYTCGECLTCLDTNGDISVCSSLCITCTCGAGDPATKPNCYRPCERPVCPRYAATAAPLDGSYTGKNSGPSRIVRGGNYDLETDSRLDCAGRSDNRSRHISPDESPFLNVGFRCAKNL